MARWFCGALASVLLISGAALADEVRGKIVKVDADKKVVMLKVGDKAVEYVIDDGCKLPYVNAGAVGKKPNGKNGNGAGKPMTLKDLAQRVEFTQDKGLPVIVQVAAKPETAKESIVEIQIDRGEKPSKLDKRK